MKKIISIALILVLLLCMIPTSAFAISLGSDEWQEAAKKSGISGEGTRGKPYLISKEYQFVLLMKYVDKGEEFDSIYFRLTDDIELSYKTVHVYSTKKVFFEGCFDGNGHSIKLEINKAPFKGLFWEIGRSGVVKNLIITGSIVPSSRNEQLYGAIICQENSGLIMNCVNDCSAINMANFCVICGNNEGKIINCVNNTAIGGLHCIAGICYANKGTLVNCVNYGEIEDAIQNGGICVINKGTIENCYYTNAPDNGIGTMLSEEQITAESGTDGALIDLLNGYTPEKSLKREWLSWTTDDNGYPQLDYSKTKLTGSILSQGYPEIVYGIGGLAVGFLAAMLIFRKKKVAVSSTSTDDEE